MHCDEARSALLDALDDAGAGAAPEVERHLEGCADCRALAEDIQAMRLRARVWHELDAPRWPGILSGPGPIAGHAGFGWHALLQRWLPLAASTVALLLAVSVYQRPDPAVIPHAPLTDAAPAPAGTADTRAAEPDLLATPAAQALLAASRRERQREMEALATLLKAELDRQQSETQDSLEYLLTHLIRSERELNALEGRLLRTDARTTEMF